MSSRLGNFSLAPCGFPLVMQKVESAEVSVGQKPRKGKKEKEIRGSVFSVRVSKWM